MPTETADIAIVGAGPAGMAAAIACAGQKTVVLDDQPAPGGQVWRAVEAVNARGGMGLFGADYAEGLRTVQRFRSAGVDYRPEARVIGVEDRENGDSGDVLYVRNGRAQRLSARRLIVATGAYERPMPFPGWTLPGVMTAGAAQIALKTADLAPARPFVLAGQGPLFLLLAAQFRKAGAAPDVLLRLDDPGSVSRALAHAPGAMFSLKDIAKGLGWRAAIGKGVGRVASDVTSLEAIGADKLERVCWRTAGGAMDETPAATLLVHDGVVPNAQLLRSMRAPLWHDASQAAWRPKLDSVAGQLNGRPWVHVAGDAAGIGGWKAAVAMGALAGGAAALSLGQDGTLDTEAMRRLGRARAIRPMLEALYPPARAFSQPADDTIVCRCEEVTAGQVRNAVAQGAQGANQLKAFLRAGMGPCQGRMCAQTTAAIIADAQEKSAGDVPPMRVRMPISPVTLQEMAGLNDTPMDLPSA